MRCLIEYLHELPLSGTDFTLSLAKVAMTTAFLT